MTYTMTAQQIADLRSDLALDADAVFTDVQIQRFYERADGGEAMTRVYCLRYLVSATASLVDYKAGSSSESASQIHQHYRGLLKQWEMEAGIGGVTIQVGTFGLNIDADDDNQSEWDGSDA
jgi:hypothetical protein